MDRCNGGGVKKGALRGTLALPVGVIGFAKER